MPNSQGLSYRLIEPEEFARFAWTASRGFGEEIDDSRVEILRQTIEHDRTWVAFEEGHMVGTFAVLSMELTVPGGRRLPMGGVTWVAVLPSHRRRGILTELMRLGLRDSRERGEALSGLGASEATIYGRFGFGPATFHAGYEIDTLQAKLRNPVEDHLGRLRQLNCTEAESILPAVYERFGRDRAGAVSRSPGWWKECLSDPQQDRQESGALSVLVHLDESGQADGYATYRMKEGWQQWLPEGWLKLVEVVAGSPATRDFLWQTVLSMDLVRTVEVEQAPLDDPLRWLLGDSRQLRTRYTADDLWVRLLDLPRALAGRSYRIPGRLVLEVADAQVPANSRRLALEAAGEGAEVARTDEPPDIVLDVSTLGALYLGGLSFELLRQAGRLREVTAGAGRRADLMFGETPAPYAGTHF